VKETAFTHTISHILIIAASDISLKAINAKRVLVLLKPDPGIGGTRQSQEFIAGGTLHGLAESARHLAQPSRIFETGAFE
jgi:hypothetical protein